MLLIAICASDPLLLILSVKLGILGVKIREDKGRRETPVSEGERKKNLSVNMYIYIVLIR